MQRNKTAVAADKFYINLDRVPARKAFMERQFAQAGVPRTQRFSAVDAGQPGALDTNGYVPGSGSRWGLKPSEIACFESHRRVWLQARESDLSAFAVFEDDVQLSETSAKVIEALLAAPGDYDMVKLDYSPRVLRFGAAGRIGGVEVRPMLEMVPSAAAYILSRAGADKLLAWSANYSDHLDDFISIPRPGWRMFQTFPAIGIQLVWSAARPDEDRSVTTSERTQAAAINSGLDKGPLWFRLRRELKAVRRKLHWRAGGQARLLRQGGYVGHIPCGRDIAG